LEVLGVSLLWDGICKEINLGPDAESETHPSEQQKTLMMPPPDVKALPLPHMEAAKPSPVIEGFDWLTGHWDEQIQPTNPFLNDSDVIHTATNPFLTWDPFASELSSGPPSTGGSGAPQQPKSTNSPSTLVSRAAIGDYVEFAKKKFGSDPVCDSTPASEVQIMLGVEIDTSLVLCSYCEEEAFYTGVLGVCTTGKYFDVSRSNGA
jgi:hypothetical protein